MHDACMATKTISLRIEAWERLRRARRSPDESFSDVVMRAEWPEAGMTGREIRAVYDREGAHLSAASLERIETVTREDRPPRDKWSER